MRTDKDLPLESNIEVYAEHDEFMPLTNGKTLSKKAARCVLNYLPKLSAGDTSWLLREACETLHQKLTAHSAQNSYQESLKIRLASRKYSTVKNPSMSVKAPIKNHSDAGSEYRSTNAIRNNTNQTAKTMTGNIEESGL